MKLAFSTSIAPGGAVEEAIACAKRLGVEGIELVAPPADPVAAGEAARQAGIELACLATSAAFTFARRRRRAKSGLGFITAARYRSIRGVSTCSLTLRPRWVRDRSQASKSLDRTQRE